MPVQRPEQERQEGRPVRRMRRPERREQILDAATTAFARSGGFTATSLDDIAAEAGVTRMILYRHFASKTELYQAVIDRAAERLHAAATARGGLSEETVPAMMDWAAAEPDAFRLLFHHAVREPEFRGDIDQLRAGMARTLRPHLAAEADSEAWADWAAGLATTVAIEAIMAWLDAGQPDLEKARRRVLRAIDGVYQALTVH